MNKSILAFLGLSSSIFSAQNADCTPEPSATCYPDDCKSCYCLGPENIISNSPVCPLTCNGDWDLNFSGLYWTPHEDGLEYALTTEATAPTVDQNELINANFKAPNFKWDFGFKLGLDYCTTCDGWDFGVTWTWFQGHANSHDEVEINDQGVLIPIWSVFTTFAGIEESKDIESAWQLEMNLIDLDLGRSFWTSKYLSIRPHIGLRISYLSQDYTINRKRLSALRGNNKNDTVKLNNDFKGLGVRAGLDSTWNFGCGWALFGNFATSIIYGRFDIDHDETTREPFTPFTKEKVLGSKDSFHSSRSMFESSLGIQWSTLFCDCKYGLTAKLGFEQQLFFHQNQLWRAVVINTSLNFPDTNSNRFSQRRGTLDVHGFTLTVDFAF